MHLLIRVDAICVLISEGYYCAQRIQYNRCRRNMVCKFVGKNSSAKSSSVKNSAVPGAPKSLNTTENPL